MKTVKHMVISLAKIRERHHHHSEVERIKTDRESNQRHLIRKLATVQRQKEEQRVKLERRLRSRSSSPPKKSSETAGAASKPLNAIVVEDGKEHHLH